MSVILRKENIFSTVFAIYLNALLIVDLTRMLFNNQILVSVTRFLLYGICSLYTYYHMIYIKNLKVNKHVVGIFITLLVSFILSTMIHNEIFVLTKYFIPLLIIRIIPGIYLSYYLNIDCINNLFNKMEKYRFIWIIYAVSGTFWIADNFANGYSITFGYNLLIPTCYTIFKLYDKFKIKWLIYSLIFVLFIIIYGSRAPLLDVIIYIIFLYILYNKNGKLKFSYMLLFKILVIVTLSVLTIIYFNKIFEVLSKVFPKSRTVQLLATDISFDSGRSELHITFWDAIRKHPLRINGIFSDRVYYSQYKNIEFNLHNHPHNILIELLYQWGVFIGLFIFYIIFRIILRSLSYCIRISNKELLSLFLTIILVGYFKLFLSDSYLVNVYFYVLIGLALNISKQKDNNLNIE